VYTRSLSGESTYQLKLDLPPGLYFAKISSKSLNGVKSFVVR
jgi:hypothetical protein